MRIEAAPAVYKKSSCSRLDEYFIPSILFPNEWEAEHWTDDPNIELVQYPASWDAAKGVWYYETMEEE